MTRAADTLPNLSTMADVLRGPAAGWLATVDRPLDLRPELGTELTGRVVGDLILETAGRLRAAGIAAGDRIAIVKSNHLDIPVIASAAVRIGAFAALLSGEIASFDTEAMLRRLENPILITDRRTLREGSLAGLELGGVVARVIVLDGDGDERLPLAAPAEDPPVELAGTAPIIVTHTSGTTGTPKLVVQSTSSLAGHVRPQTMLMKMLRLRNKPYAVHLAFGHVRTLTLVLGALKVGIPLVVVTSPDATTAGQFLARHRPHCLETYPNVYTLWERLADDPSRPLANVGVFFSSFDALHSRTCRRILGGSRRRIPVMISSLGLSEMGPLTIKPFTRWVLAHSDSRCIGFPIPAVQVRIVDQTTDAPVRGRSVNGKLHARSTAKLVTYFGEDERAARASDGSWFATGDIAHRTRWGCVHLMDREPEFDASFGSGLKVEDTLMERLAILSEVAIIHGEGGPPTPVIATFGDQPLPPDVWRSAVADLPPMAPPLQRTWKEFPRTATFKVRRWRLRKEIESSGVAAV